MFIRETQLEPWKKKTVKGQVQKTDLVAGENLVQKRIGETTLLDNGVFVNDTAKKSVGNRNGIPCDDMRSPS